MCVCLLFWPLSRPRVCLVKRAVQWFYSFTNWTCHIPKLLTQWAKYLWWWFRLMQPRFKGNIDTACAWCETCTVLSRRVCDRTWSQVNNSPSTKHNRKLWLRDQFISFTQPSHTSALRLTWDVTQVVVFISQLFSVHIIPNYSLVCLKQVCSCLNQLRQLWAFKRLLWSTFSEVRWG